MEEGIGDGGMGKAGMGHGSMGEEGPGEGGTAAIVEGIGKRPANEWDRGSGGTAGEGLYLRATSVIAGDMGMGSEGILGLARRGSVLKSGAEVSSALLAAGPSIMVQRARRIASASRDATLRRTDRRRLFASVSSGVRIGGGSPSRRLVPTSCTGPFRLGWDSPEEKVENMIEHSRQEQAQRGKSKDERVEVVQG